MSSTDDKHGTARGAPFATTDWSVVRASGHAETTEARVALETLCRLYWRPLYAYSRRQGRSPHDAQDLTQGFLARLLERNAIGQADAGKGRFRTFLLTAFKNFLHDEWEKGRAQKRGGGQADLTIDTSGAEEGLELATDATPEKIYERRWALTLLEQALARLEAEHKRVGREQLFAELHPFLLGEGTEGYAAAAARLRMTEGAVKVAAHRLRRRYREVIRVEIARTVSDAGEIEDELQRLQAALSR